MIEYAHQLGKALQNLDNSIFSKIIEYDLDCDILPSLEDYMSKITQPNLIGLLENEHNIKPALYWFEIVSDHPALEIYTPYKNLRFERSIPAYKKTFSKWDSKVLYVGKVKNNLAGRMIIHLGYYSNPKTQGLQLLYWKHVSGFKLKLKIIYLPKNLEDVVGVLEKRLASQLHPILGKHR